MKKKAICFQDKTNIIHSTLVAKKKHPADSSEPAGWMVKIYGLGDVSPNCHM